MYSIYIYIQSYTYTHTHTIYIYICMYICMYIYRYMYTHSDTHTHCAHLSSVFCFHFKNDQATLFPKTDDWNHQLRRLMLLVLRPKRFIGPCWKGKPLGRLGQLVFRFRILEMQCIVIYIYNIYIYNIYILDPCGPVNSRFLFTHQLAALRRFPGGPGDDNQGHVGGHGGCTVAPELGVV